MTYSLLSGLHHIRCHQSGLADPPSGTAHTVEDRQKLLLVINKIKTYYYLNCLNICMVLDNERLLITVKQNIDKQQRAAIKTIMHSFQFCLKKEEETLVLPVVVISITLLLYSGTPCGSLKNAVTAFGLQLP